MSLDITRAWKDQTYRENLSAEERAQLPANPAGEIELSEADLAAVYGGDGWGEEGGNYGWDGMNGMQTERNSHICSILCSHTCRIGILDLLGPRL